MSHNMTPQQLKNSILQLAIQGRLVEQRAEEGTGAELYRKIQAEKKRLVKEGRIKKEKPLPEISEDEKPFDIPESWVWVRLGALLRIIGGVSYDKKDVTTSGYRILRGGNIQQMKVLLEDSDVFLPEQYGDKDKMIREGDILIVASTGSKAVIGKAGYVDRPIADTMIGAFLRICRPFQFSTVNYLRYVFDSDFYRKHIRVSSQGTNINNVKESYITEFAIPFPPMAEQRRIVTKIEELLPLIDRYAAAWERLEAFNTRFPLDMQKSLLQIAVQGKLVEQRAEEGTGEELYREIQKEKTRLVREGKLKKEKPLPEITEDEIPFDIPENWKWVNVSQIAFKVTDGTHKTPAYTQSGIKFVSAKDISNGTLSFEKCRYISEDEHGFLYKRCNPERGDILVSKSGSIGTVVINEYDFPFSLFESLALVKYPQDMVAPKYFRFAMQYGCYHLTDKDIKGVAVKHLPIQAVGKMLIPLPPLAEQKRIVAKLNEMLPLCEGLKG